MLNIFIMFNHFSKFINFYLGQFQFSWTFLNQTLLSPIGVLERVEVSTELSHKMFLFLFLNVVLFSFYHIQGQPLVVQEYTPVISIGSAEEYETTLNEERGLQFMKVAKMRKHAACEMVYMANVPEGFDARVKQPIFSI